MQPHRVLPQGEASAHGGGEPTPLTGAQTPPDTGPRPGPQLTIVRRERPTALPFPGEAAPSAGQGGLTRGGDAGGEGEEEERRGKATSTSAGSRSEAGGAEPGSPHPPKRSRCEAAPTAPPAAAILALPAGRGRSRPRLRAAPPRALRGPGRASGRAGRRGRLWRRGRGAREGSKRAAGPAR